jgi:hypothetical protein
MNVFMVTPPLVKTSLLDRNAQKERYKTRRGITRVGNAGMTGCYKSVVGGREETLRRLADPSNQIRQTKQPHRVRGASSLYHIPIGLGRARPPYDSLGAYGRPPECVGLVSRVLLKKSITNLYKTPNNGVSGRQLRFLAPLGTPISRLAPKNYRKKAEQILSMCR